MKIKKFELQKIINEEVQKIMHEADWLGKTTKFMGTLGKEFVKGFMGSGKGDNLLSQAAYRAWGGTRVSAIDDTFQELMENLKDLRAAPEEVEKIVDPMAGEGQGKQKPAKVLDDFIDLLNEEIIKDWISMTASMRGEEKKEEPPSKEAEPAAPEEGGEEGGGDIAEVIRRETRAQLKKHLTS
jgi:hypothetical protein